MDVPRAADDPLGQPTRARLFSLLAELRRPAGTEELARHLGLHPNGVRVHLERMLRAGLLRRERERGGAGRPRDTWRVSPDALPAGEPPTAYADLSRWLARAVAAAGDAEAAGREIGRELAPATPGAPPPGEERLFAALAALGFRPESGREAGALTYRLRNCPYRAAARQDPQVVCALHRGMTRGLLERIDPATRLTAFVPEDPDRAGCLIELRGPLADGEGSGTG